MVAHPRTLPPVVSPSPQLAFRRDVTSALDHTEHAIGNLMLGPPHRPGDVTPLPIVAPAVPARAQALLGVQDLDHALGLNAGYGTRVLDAVRNARADLLRGVDLLGSPVMSLNPSLGKFDSARTWLRIAQNLTATR